MSIFVRDTCTGTTGARMTTRAGEVGATWTKNTVLGDLAITAAGRVRVDDSATGIILKASGVPPSPNYRIDFQMCAQSIISGHFNGVIGRGFGTYNNGYRLEYDHGNTGFLFYATDDIANTLLTYASFAFTLGVVYDCRLELYDALKAFYVTDMVTPILSSADNSYTAAGYVALTGYAGTAPSDSTGLHIDNVIASTADKATPLFQHHRRVQLYSRKKVRMM